MAIDESPSHEMSDGQRQLYALVRVYSPRLMVVAKAFAGGAEEAEDILQDVWLIATDKSRRDPIPDHAGAWLFGITVNVGRKYLRRRRYRKALTLLWGQTAWPQADATMPPSISLELQKTQLWQAIGRLPPLQRRVLMLRVTEGCTSKETARVIGRAEGTVKASLYRALATLKKTLNPNDNE